jgi:hypothetical protein
MKKADKLTLIKGASGIARAERIANAVPVKSSRVFEDKRRKERDSKSWKKLAAAYY